MPSRDEPTADLVDRQSMDGDILVALNPSPLDHDNATYLLRVAAQSAKRLRILVIEDERLHQLATLPFTNEVDWIGASQKRLNTVDVGRMLRAQTERVRSIIVKLASEFDVSYSVNVVRGKFLDKALSERRERIVVLGARRQWHAIRRANYSTGFGRAVSIFDGSDASVRACRAADRFAPAASPVTILLPAENSADCQALQHRLASVVPDIDDARWEVICVAPDELEAAVRELGRDPDRFLVLPRAGILDYETTEPEFARNIRGNLALVT
ncbi:MAG: hypothetical protein K0U93_28995 [Gammaproteobacteria bacterium]|nr:hypothetical protein [Gammaproteobacteria bacterium]